MIFHTFKYFRIEQPWLVTVVLPKPTWERIPVLWIRMALIWNGFIRQEGVDRTRELLLEIEKNKQATEQEQTIVIDDIEFEKTFGETQSVILMKFT